MDKAEDLETIITTQAQVQFEILCIEHQLESTPEKFAIFCRGASFGIAKCREIYPKL